MPSQLDELEVPKGWGPGLDYAFLSPVFDSISKEGYKSAGFEKDRLATAIKGSGVSVIALGGECFP